MSGDQGAVADFSNGKVVGLLTSMEQSPTFVPDFGATSGLEVLLEGATEARVAQALAMVDVYLAKAQTASQGVVSDGVTLPAMWRSDILPLLVPNNEIATSNKVVTIKALLAFAASTELFAPFAIAEAADCCAKVGSNIEAAALYIFLVEQSVSFEDKGAYLELAHKNFSASGETTAAEAIMRRLIKDSKTPQERHANMSLLAELLEKRNMPEQAAGVRAWRDREVAAMEMNIVEQSTASFENAKRLIDVGDKAGAKFALEHAMLLLESNGNRYSAAVQREAFALSYSMRFGNDPYYVEQLFLVATNYYIAAKKHMAKPDSVEFKMLSHEFVEALNFAFSQSFELELAKATAEAKNSLSADAGQAIDAQAMNAKVGELAAARLLQNFLGPDTEAVSRINDLALPVDYYCERAAAAIVMTYRRVAELAGNNTELKIAAVEKAIAAGIRVAEEVSGKGNSDLAQKMVLTIYTMIAAQNGFFSRERSLIRERVIEFYNNRAGEQSVSFGVRFAMFRLRFISELIPNIERVGGGGFVDGSNATAGVDGFVDLTTEQAFAPAEKRARPRSTGLEVDGKVVPDRAALEAGKAVVERAAGGSGKGREIPELRGKK